MIKLLNMDCIEFMASQADKSLLVKRKKSARMKVWYQNNKQELMLKAKIYRDNNKERFNNYRNNYRTKTASGIYDVIKQGAKKRSLEFILDRTEFVKWHESHPKKCFYCNRTEDEIIKDNVIIRNKMTRLTVDRMNNDFGYELKNLTLACMRCNSIKSNFFTVDEMLQIGKIINEKSKCLK